MAEGGEGKATGMGQGAGGIHTLPPESNRLIPGVWQGALW